LVTTSDVLYSAARYYTSDATADLDQDGLVQLDDILIVIYQYGTSC
jgi:hypothetical protein